MNALDAKYVSVDYMAWHQKYLPMEEENTRLKEELKKTSGRLQVSCWYGGWKSLNFQTLDFSLKGLEALTQEQKETILREIQEYIQSQCSPGRTFLTKEQASQLKEEWESRQKDLELRILHIPRIIRRIFKIS
jgi:hypothetical protein